MQSSQPTDQHQHDPEADATAEPTAVETTSTNAPAEGEKALIRFHPAMARRYPVRTAGYWVLAVLGVGLLIYGLTNDVWAITWLLGAALVVFGIVKLGAWYLRLRKTEITVSSKRITITTGTINVHSSEVLTENISDVFVNQNFLNRLLNVGDLVLTTTGEDGRTVVLMAVHKPDIVANVIRAHEIEAEPSAPENPKLSPDTL